MATFQKGIAREARNLLGADLHLSSNRPLPESARRAIKRLEETGARKTEMLSLVSMLKRKGGTEAPFMVNVKAIRPEYPLYGQLETTPREAVSSLFSGDRCLLEESLATRYSLKKGDRVSLGILDLEVAGILHSEPDRSMTSFRLAPTVIVAKKVIERAGLVSFGARIRHRLLVALPESADPRQEAIDQGHRLETEIDDPYVSIRPFAAAQPAMRDGLKRVALFFSLISLITLLLGAVGMGSGFSAFLNEQTETAALLRCLGARPLRSGDDLRIFGPQHRGPRGNFRVWSWAFVKPWGTDLFKILPRTPSGNSSGH